MPKGFSYTAVRLCTHNGDISKPWFIYFSFTDHALDVTKRFQLRKGINFYKTVEERTRQGNQVAREWEQYLKDGWNPFLHSSMPNFSRMKLNEALDFALSKSKLSTKSYKDYRCTVNFIKSAAKTLHLDKALVTGIKRQHIKLLMDEVMRAREWENPAYNKNLGYLSAVLSILVEYEIIEHNPAFRIKSLPVAETQKFEPISETEKYAIKAYLLEHMPAFFTYLMVIYHTGIRPKEALYLKISDMRFDRRTIVIKPDLEKENSKTKTIRMVPINDHLASLLLRHAEGYRSDYFLFGSLFKKGEGSRGGGSQKNGTYGARMTDYFKPSPTMIKRDTATKLWNKLIMQDLKIQKHMYAMKHTGADDKILAGISLDALREMYGHTSKYMTEKYARKIKEVYKDEILKSSPAF